MHQMGIPTNATSYEPNSIDGGWPKEKPVERGGFASYLETLQGDKRRIRAESFADHFSQAKLFYNSQSAVEQEHIAAAFSFELAKVATVAIRERTLGLLANVDADLAAQVAAKVGAAVPAPTGGNGKAEGKAAPPSPALSILDTPDKQTVSAKGRKVAILAADGVDGAQIDAMKAALAGAGAEGLVLGPHLGTLAGAAGPVAVDHTLVTMPSVAFDAVFVPGGAASAGRLTGDGDAVHFLAEAYKHCKAVAVLGAGAALLEAAGIRAAGSPGLIVSPDGGVAQVADLFIEAIAGHRAWNRSDKDAIPA